MILCYYKNKMVGPFPSIPTEQQIDAIKQFINDHLHMLPDSINVIENAKYDDFFTLYKE